MKLYIREKCSFHKGDRAVLDLVGGVQGENWTVCERGLDLAESRGSSKLDLGMVNDRVDSL